MSEVTVREMDSSDEYFVGTCSHVDESPEIDACSERRIAWLREMREQGMSVKVALLDGKRVGFIYLIPIELSPWGPVGRDLTAIPCLWVVRDAQGSGAGRALMQEAEREARCRGGKGLAVVAYHTDFWFMPASFFEKLGYTAAQRRENEAIMWKAFDPGAKPPDFLTADYRFEPVEGKTVIDLFWNTLCLTSAGEAQRVREVVAEFGDKLVLHEYCADDRDTLRRYQIPRAIFVNGKEIGWGYEAPKEGIREAISEALGSNR